MKKVWSSPSLVQCDLVKALLEGDGITCFIQDEYAARFTGVGYPTPAGQALGFAWPELWVPDEELERAQELVAVFAGGE